MVHITSMVWLVYIFRSISITTGMSTLAKSSIDMWWSVYIHTDESVLFTFLMFPYGYFIRSLMLEVETSYHYLLLFVLGDDN